MSSILFYKDSFKFHLTVECFVVWDLHHVKVLSQGLWHHGVFFFLNFRLELVDELPKISQTFSDPS